MLPKAGSLWRQTPISRALFCMFFGVYEIPDDIFTMAQQSLVGQGLLIIQASRSHSDTVLSSGLLWTNDQPDAGYSTRNTQH
jgi:hypothetical protein